MSEFVKPILRVCQWILSKIEDGSDITIAQNEIEISVKMRKGKFVLYLPQREGDRAYARWVRERNFEVVVKQFYVNNEDINLLRNIIDDIQRLDYEHADERLDKAFEKDC